MKPETEEANSDGSGGAFEGTELPREEHDRPEARDADKDRNDKDGAEENADKDEPAY